MRALHAGVAAGETPETWIAVEHDPVVTVGRQGRGAAIRGGHENLIVSPERLAERGIEFHEVERGGDVTYHGPGQAVVYPIVRLERFREVVPLVRALEEAVLRVCAGYGIAAERWADHAGVWAGENCVCAIGLAVQRMTSLHGIALNVSTALDYDRLINPCGLAERGITSLSRELGRKVAMPDAHDRMFRELGSVFERRFELTAAAPGCDLMPFADPAASFTAASFTAASFTAASLPAARAS